jgi:hypothetical protein
MRNTVCDDSSGQHRPNAGKVFQLGGCAVIQIHDESRHCSGLPYFPVRHSMNGLDDLFPTKRRNMHSLVFMAGGAGLNRV